MWDCFVHSDERRFRGGQGKGQLLDESKGASVWVTGRAGWALGCYYSHYRRPPFRDRILSVSFSWNTFDRYRSGNASFPSICLSRRLIHLHERRERAGLFPQQKCPIIFLC